MANPYAYMDSLGAGLAQVPAAYRYGQELEQQKQLEAEQRAIQMQQMRQASSDTQAMRQAIQMAGPDLATYEGLKKMGGYLAGMGHPQAPTIMQQLPAVQEQEKLRIASSVAKDIAMGYGDSANKGFEMLDAHDPSGTKQRYVGREKDSMGNDVYVVRRTAPDGKTEDVRLDSNHLSLMASGDVQGFAKYDQQLKLAKMRGTGLKANTYAWLEHQIDMFQEGSPQWQNAVMLRDLFIEKEKQRVTQHIDDKFNVYSNLTPSQISRAISAYKTGVREKPTARNNDAHIINAIADDMLNDDKLAKGLINIHTDKMNTRWGAKEYGRPEDQATYSGKSFMDTKIENKTKQETASSFASDRPGTYGFVKNRIPMAISHLKDFEEALNDYNAGRPLKSNQITTSLKQAAERLYGDPNAPIKADLIRVFLIEEILKLITGGVPHKEVEKELLKLMPSYVSASQVPQIIDAALGVMKPRIQSTDNAWRQIRSGHVLDEVPASLIDWLTSKGEKGRMIEETWGEKQERLRRGGKEPESPYPVGEYKTPEQQREETKQQNLKNAQARRKGKGGGTPPAKAPSSQAKPGKVKMKIGDTTPDGKHRLVRNKQTGRPELVPIR